MRGGEARYGNMTGTSYKKGTHARQACNIKLKILSLQVLFKVQSH